MAVAMRLVATQVSAAASVAFGCAQRIFSARRALWEGSSLLAVARREHTMTQRTLVVPDCVTERTATFERNEAT
jgi:hypothetical protein